LPAHRILCAAAKPSNRRALFAAFARPGWTVECVCDGGEALDHFAKYGAPDLLVTSHALPRVDGVSLVRRMRRAGFRGRILVVCESLSPVERAAYRALHVTAIFVSPPPRAVLLAAAELPAA